MLRRLGIGAVGGAVVLSGLVAIGQSAAQAGAGQDTGFGSGARVSEQDETGVVGFVGARGGQALDSGFGASARPAQVAAGYLSAHADEFGLDAAGTTLRTTQRIATTTGTAVRVQQVYRGVPVLGGEYVVNLDDANDVLSVLGEASPISKVSTTPAVSGAEAADIAVAAVAKSEQVKPGSLSSATPELSIFDPRLLGAPSPFQGPRLAWVGEVRSDSAPLGQLVVVDAATGSVALSFDTVHPAKNRTVCDANNTSGQYPCTSPLRTEASPPVASDDDDVELAFKYAGDTYDFFFNRFGRDSLNGAGMTLISTADYCDPSYPCPYQNAFWDGSQMVYGDGFASADDVVGHELSHGVTDFSSSLFYYFQSGAINESMSDVFGELIDQTNLPADPAGDKWLLGEDIPGIGAIRNMANPPAFGDPDRMLSPLYWPDNNETDAGGVHYNSGVNNKAAFLMTDGGTFNGQTITGLGVTKTARLYYTVNNSMLVSASDYADLANALRGACANLAGAGTDGISTADCAQVEKVLLATEMDQNPTTAPTTTATQCPTGTSVTATTLSDNLETPSGQFVTASTVGSNAWAYPQNPNVLSGFDATYATSGETNIWGYNRPTLADYTIRMATPVTVPANGYLFFKHAYGFEDSTSGATAYDGGVVEYSTNGGGTWTDAGSLFAAPGGAGGYNKTISTGFSNPLGGRAAFGSESNGYGASRASLASLAGQSVMFRWRIGTDTSADDYGWFIDDVSVVACGTTPTTTPPTTPPADTTPPDTTITKGPKKKTTAKKAKFVFTATEAGSSFQCKVDKKAWKDCTSPTKLKKLKKGKHTFLVKATDAAGNTDATPAKYKWKVKKKKS